MLDDDPRDRRLLVLGAFSRLIPRFSLLQARCTLHNLGSCFMLADVVNFHHSHAGLVMPNNADYDAICKLCSIRMQRFRHIICHGCFAVKQNRLLGCLADPPERRRPVGESFAGRWLFIFSVVCLRSDSFGGQARV